MSVVSLARGILAVVAASLLLAAVALAAKPLAGKTYSGHVTGNRTQTISFSVSPSGKKLVLDSDLPIVQKCTGPVSGFGGIGTQVPKSVKITKKGTFKAKVAIRILNQGIQGSSWGKRYGTEIITGTFLKNGAEKGKITSRFTTRILSNCAGTTVKYTASAS